MSKLQLTPAAVQAAASGDILNFIAAATPGGIERQEAQGQCAFVGKADSLPIDCQCRPQLESLGFVFGESIDNLFVSVQFPDGWSKKATDHSMWSNLVDPKGRVRASMFYKAAFYDRSAHMRELNCRYIISKNYDEKEPRSNHVMDDGLPEKTILFTGPKESPTTSDWKQNDANRRAEIQPCEDWLERHFPNYKDPLAYWD